YRDITQRQRVPGTDFRSLAGDEHVADGDARRGQDVALLAVGVVEERDPGVAVRVVFDLRHLCRDPVLLPPEVDEPVALLVPSPAMTGGAAPVHIAASGRRLGGGERPFRTVPGDLGEVRDRLEPASGARRLAFA